ncbi:MAG: hypothetical protein IM333_15235, partial [Microcystis sp. M048S1]|nr:hypothetical protein [Microcystis sp. M135S2]MCA2894214.1 hypothetical protein [Microcystis sp. M048S1]
LGIGQISYQLSVISYQLSVIGYQLSVISYQLSVISYQLSVISYQLSVHCLQQKTSHSPIPFKQDLGLNPGFSVSAGPGDKTL